CSVYSPSIHPRLFLVAVFFFFFSSRRRHTRFSRDWSSDVCSSDLEPLPVAATFDFRDENGDSLSDVSRLDTMVTVVDAANLLKDYSSQDFLRDRGEVAGEGDDRALVDLLVEQIEFADVIVLNKVSDTPPHDLDLARKIIRSLNPDAELVEADFGRVALDKV